MNNEAISSEAASRPRILCLTSHAPAGPAYGARLRARNIFRLLNRLGDVRVALVGPYEIAAGSVETVESALNPTDVFEFQPWETRSLGERVRREFDARCLNTHGGRLSESDRRRLQLLMDGHDLIWIHGLRVANSSGLWRWPRSILDVDDIPSCLHWSAFGRARGVREKLRHFREAAQWRRRERLLLERFDAVTVCSEADRAQLGGSDRIFVAPNGFDTPSETPLRTATTMRIGFVGTLQYGPNATGLRWFIEKVWPLVRRSAPGVTLRLAGRDSDRPEWRGLEQVEGLGFVADANAEMATWALTVVPLFVGGGTRVKIATAFSRKCPVVATTLGAFGYDVSDGRELLLADTPEEFAAACVRLLQERALAECLAENAWKLFLEKWTWDAIAPKVAAAARFCLEREGRFGSTIKRSGTAEPASAPA